jgi:UDP-2,4-diacetamido-2,4,6-trideoxy-beta-L-altropyranose hydrolase
MKFYFRVDASSQIGNGHVMRCLALAKSLKKKGAKCTFICKKYKNDLIKKIKIEGFEVNVIHNYKIKKLNNTCVLSKHKNNIEHENQIINFLKNKNKIDWLIIDHYNIDHRIEKKIQPYTKNIMVIDDLANRRHNCNLLVDQNLVENYTNRYKKLLPSSCITLLGPKYALLQKKYSNLRLKKISRKKNVKRILVYFGGTDQNFLIIKTIKAFLQLNKKDVILDVILGENLSKNKALYESFFKNKKIKFYKELKSLAVLMSKADLAVGACGTTTWERCCLGLPSIVITIASNQVATAKELNKKKLILWLGSNRKVTVKQIYNALTKVINKKLNKWSDRCMQITDGCGAEKVASILMINSKSKLRSRYAKLEDEKMLLNWANDLTVRKNSFSRKKIQSNSHNKWFYNIIKSSNCSRILIIETIDGLPIGQVRIEKKEYNTWFIDYSLVNYARGKKIGHRIIKIALNCFKKIGVTNIFAKVKTTNTASLKVFEKVGYKEKIEFKKDFITYKLK